MALIKQIELENGVVLNYHRITSITNITNINTTFEISSYVSENKRLEEKAYQELQMKENRNQEEEKELEKGINVYIETDFLQIPYVENIKIEDAYDYLKTTDKYKNAEDI